MTSHSHKVISQQDKPAQCLKGLNVSVSVIAPLKGQCEEQAGKFTCCVVGKGTQRDSLILVWWTDGMQLLSELVVTEG